MITITITICELLVSVYLQGIHPNMTCGSSAPDDTSCVANAICNHLINLCVCDIEYKATTTSCKFFFKDLFILHSINVIKICINMYI